MKWLTIGVLGVVGGLLGSGAQAGFDRQDLQVPGSLLWVTPSDLDGDGWTDLVVSYLRGRGPKAQRYIGVFFRSEKGYPGRPQLAFAAPNGAGAFDVGDAVGDAAEELLYLTSSGVFVQPVVDRKAQRPVRLLGASTLMTGPEENDLVAWDFLRKIEPDKPPLLIVPGRRALRLYRRNGDKFESFHDLRVDMMSYIDAESPTYRRSRRGGGPGRQYAFRVTTIIPNVDFIDQTGDGRWDVVTHYEDRVAVFAQDAEGKLAERPTKRQWFSVRTPEEQEARDSGVSAQIQDLDGDGIADLCLAKIGGGLSTLKTELRLYRGLAGGGFETTPAQVFEDEGFANLVTFRDVNGDGRLEMIHPHSEVSIMSMSRALLSQTISLDVRIRKQASAPKFFNPKPIQTVTARYGLDFTVGTAIRGTAPLFGYDFNQDRRLDVILPEGSDKMGLHRGQTGEDDWFEDEARIRLSAPGTNQTLIVPSRSDDKARPDLLMYYVARKDLTGKLYVFSYTND